MNGVLATRAYSSPHNLADDPPKKLKTIREFQGFPIPAGPKDGIWVLQAALERWRERVSARLAPADRTGVFRALMLHESGPEHDLGMFRLLGLVHLSTAAGVHLYAIQRIWLAAGFWLTTILGISPRKGRRIAESIALISTLAAWALAGFRFGMARPWVVIALRNLAREQGIRFRILSPLLIALAMELTAGLLRGEPLSPSSGRWIYALAVGGAVLAADGFHGKPLRSHFRMAISSWSGTALLETWITGLCAPLTPILSLVTLPIFCSLLYPLLFASSLLPGLPVQLPLELANWLLERISEILLNIPSLWVVPRWSLILGLGAGAWAAALPPRNAWIVTISAAIAAALTITLKSMIYEKSPRVHEISVTQLDVGQGDAALVRSKVPTAYMKSWIETFEVGLIDTGAPRALRPGKWIELIASEGATRLDWVALTHLDQDHAGGLSELSRIVPIRCVEVSEAELLTPRGMEMSAEWRKRGIRVGPRCFPYSSIHPKETRNGIPKHRKGTHATGNERMSAYLVPLVQQGKRWGSYLSAGDADARVEPQIARWALQQGWDSELPFRVLKISHHGSRTSSNPETFRLLKPTEAWLSSGAGNRYGHPHSGVLALLGSQSALKLRRTDSEGALRPSRPSRNSGVGDEPLGQNGHTSIRSFKWKDSILGVKTSIRKGDLDF